MTFQEAQDYLYQANQFGIRPGLMRIRELLRRWGDPQKSFRCVHIAGTNGKGTVSSFCAHIAACADLKTGWYTSPYLETFNERMRIISGRKGLDRFEKDFRSPEIPDLTFASYMDQIKNLIEDMVQDGFEHPTVFEIETAIAFKWFADESVDIAIVEVGLGGRLDSTNVFEHPITTVITALSYDHMERLGNTLREIAGEKAGILKEGVPALVYDPKDAVPSLAEASQAIQVISHKAEDLHVPIQWCSRNEIESLSVSPQGQSFRVAGMERVWTIRLCGDYQQQNALLAIRAGLSFTTEEAVAEGLSRAIWPGRLEWMRLNPPILIDGAHNSQGCQALSKEIDRFFPEQPAVFLCGMLADKQHDLMLQEVFARTKCHPAFVMTTCPPVPRGLSGEVLASEVRAACLFEVDPVGWTKDENSSSKHNGQTPNLPVIQWNDDPEEALREALKQSENRKAPLIIFGSLYLVGNIRPMLRAYLESHEEEAPC